MNKSDLDMELPLKYLAIYLGCQVTYIYAPEYPIKRFNGELDLIQLDFIIKNKEEIRDVKLYLRPFSDLTEDEAKVCFKYDYRCESTNIKPYLRSFGRTIYLFSSQTFKFLISRQFDVFGLIQSGLAFEKSKLEVNKII